MLLLNHAYDWERPWWVLPHTQGVINTFRDKLELY
jgi:hypothetical protein